MVWRLADKEECDVGWRQCGAWLTKRSVMWAGDSLALG